MYVEFWRKGRPIDSMTELQRCTPERGRVEGSHETQSVNPRGKVEELMGEGGFNEAGFEGDLPLLVEI